MIIFLDTNLEGCSPGGLMQDSGVIAMGWQRDGYGIRSRTVLDYYSRKLLTAGVGNDDYYPRHSRRLLTAGARHADYNGIGADYNGIGACAII